MTATTSDNTRSARGSKAANSALIIPDVTGMTFKEAAHAYLGAGFWPIPWKVARGKGGKLLKRPCYRKGWAYATVARETRESIDRWPSSWQVGLITSQRSGILAADIDDPDEFNGWEIDDPPVTASSDTGRDGGYHLIYDGRELAPDDWPVQGDIPGGQVKSNGFIGVEPSIHPNGKMYRWADLPRSLTPAGDFGEVLADYHRKPSGGSETEGQLDTSDLWQAVLDAGDGKQRGKMFAWARDAHDRGMTDNEIIDRLELAVLKREIRSWHPGDAWNRAGLRSAAIPTSGWRHTPNARHSEVEGIGELDDEPSLTDNYGNVEDEDVEWIWPRYCARRVLTQVDGEKGQAKSFIMFDLIARATHGRAMPGESEAICDPIDVFLFDEDVRSQTKKRLQAAGADLTRVHFPHRDYRIAIMLEKERAEAKRKRGSRRRDRDEEVPSLLLPSGAEVMMRMIRETGAGLVIWDPITDYLDETISTGIDASVRRALDPVARGLEWLGAAGIALRHMNKDSKAAARYRGGGTTAFQNRARVHLITGRLSDDFSDRGTYGLSMVDNNYVERVKGTLAYDVINSHIKLDNLGNMVGKVKWRELEDIDVDTLSRGDAGDGKPGPDPIKRTTIMEILNEMGATSAKWDAEEAKKNIRTVSRTARVQQRKR